MNKDKGKNHWNVSDSNSNLVMSMTHHNQTMELTTWFLNFPLDEYIDKKGTKFEIWIQDPIKHSLEDHKARKSSRKSLRRRKNRKANKRNEKRQTKQNGKLELR
jgi:hypothetical protein